jgi:hypothetical protein
MFNEVGISLFAFPLPDTAYSDVKLETEQRIGMILVDNHFQTVFQGFCLGA